MDSNIPTRTPPQTHPGPLDPFPQSRSTQEDDALGILRRRFHKDQDVEGTRPDYLYASRDLPVPVGKELALRIKTSDGRSHVYKFEKGNVVIGRSEDADVTLRDSKVSRKHALIEAFSREEIFLTDMASKNGVFLNKMRVRSVKLKDGDTLRIGDTHLIFSALDVAP